MARFDADGIADLLYAASDNAPPSRVSLDAVLTDGRRRRRRRAVAVPLLAAAAIALVAAGGLVAANLRPTAVEPPPGTASPSPAPTAAPTPAVVPTAFPLDRLRFTVDAFDAPRFVRLSAGAQYLGYGGGQVWVFARGADGARQTVEQGYDPLEAPPVNGLTASHLYTDDGTGPQLRGIAFQWAPGAWADIIAASPTTGAQLADLAASLRTDVDEAVRFWFTLSLPAGLRVARAEPSNEGDEGHWSSLFFIVDGPLPELPARDAPGIEVTVGEYFDGPAEPTTTVRGRPAIITDSAEYYSVELVENDGFTVRSVAVVVRGTAREHVTAEQAQDLAFSVVINGAWDDRSRWTEDPIR